jgi:hypothetical protein
MLHRQYEQTGVKDEKVFIYKTDSTKSEGGFSWGDAMEGFDFWHKIIDLKKTDVFFEKYSKVDYPKGMPEDIKIKCIDRRIEQGFSKR